MRQKTSDSRGPDGGRTKIVEMGGTPIPFIFPNKDFLTGSPGCQYPEKCFISQDQDCRATRGIYRILCKTCENRDGKKYIYIGTSGFSIHKRMLEHLKCAEAKNVSNALGKHVTLNHQNENAEFETEIIRSGNKV